MPVDVDRPGLRRRLGKPMRRPAKRFVLAAIVGLGAGGAAAAEFSVADATSSTSNSGLTYVRGCRSSGEGGLGAVWSKQALHVGPIAIGELEALTLDQIPPARRHQRWFPALENVVVVPAGMRATISVPRIERGVVGLIYDKADFHDNGLYDIQALESSVQFVACRDRRFNHGVSQFDGGVVVRGRRRFTLRIVVQGTRYNLLERLPLRDRGSSK